MSENFVENLMISPEPRKPTSTSFSGSTDGGHRETSVSTPAIVNLAEGKSEKTSDSVTAENAAVAPQTENSNHRPAFNAETLEGSAPVQNQTSAASFRAGYVAILGQPNVGKSTLLNALLQFKLSIVSPKPQTTRKRILGILNRPSSQMIFFDTPGILEAHYRLQQALVRAAFQAMKDANVHIMMVEPVAVLQPADLGILNRLADTGNPIIIAINKIDTIPKDHLLPVIEQFRDKRNVEAIIPISALQQDGIERLAEAVEQY
ncbi:MAG: GTPase Era, partial [bacterium]